MCTQQSEATENKNTRIYTLLRPLQKNTLSWFPNGYISEAKFYFYKSFWSVLRSPALETPQPGFRELNGPKSYWTWPGSAPKPPRPSAGPSPEPCPKPPLEPCWTWPGPAPKPPGTFSEIFFWTLLNLTWLCTKAFPGPLLNLTSLCTKASHTGSAPKPPTASSEPSPQPWPGSAPKPPRPSPEPSPEPSPQPFWTWPGFAPKPSGTLLNLTWLCTKASQFCGTFSGTSLNLTRCLHQGTLVLFWAEDPVSLRYWGNMNLYVYT